VEIEDKTEADDRPPLKAEPKAWMPAVPFRSTMPVTFYVRDGNRQWFEQNGLGWKPIPWPTY
jgi:hypothetical protein